MLKNPRDFRLSYPITIHDRRYLSIFHNYRNEQRTYSEALLKFEITRIFGPIQTRKIFLEIKKEHILISSYQEYFKEVILKVLWKIYSYVERYKTSNFYKFNPYFERGIVNHFFDLYEYLKILDNKVWPYEY